jgi:hypothetical protein
MAVIYLRKCPKTVNLCFVRRSSSSDIDDASTVSATQTPRYPCFSTQSLITDCGPIIQMFEECHDEHPVAKFMGACNDLKRELTLCLRAEVLLRGHPSSYKLQRKMRQRINNEIAMEKRKRFEAKWKDIEENS